MIRYVRCYDWLSLFTRLRARCCRYHCLLLAKRGAADADIYAAMLRHYVYYYAASLRRHDKRAPFFARFSTIR